jgi:hypothetical protein
LQDPRGTHKHRIWRSITIINVLIDLYRFFFKWISIIPSLVPTISINYHGLIIGTIMLEVSLATTGVTTHISISGCGRSGTRATHSRRRIVVGHSRLHRSTRMVTNRTSLTNTTRILTIEGERDGKHPLADGERVANLASSATVASASLD